MRMTPRSHPPLELWGGIECTVARVGDTYLDQIRRSGHETRLNDLDLIASLGLRAIRYPVLWERVAPQGLDSADWSWTDERLGKLRELGIRPIVGLVHHGSGPRSTSLVDPDFAEGLATFARAVADRYPWVEDYTPVNEPLTTARFSGLYGHWYPHGREDSSFARALMTQCRGVVLAMQAIREVNPAARLVQTEDLGKVFSTPRLAYQADLENERRWLTFDLLCGRLRPGDSMWRFLQRSGVAEPDLRWFRDHPCPPDILGLNHYLTSDRYLDDRLASYPPELHGGNGHDGYADIEAVRAREAGPADPCELLREAWVRYRRPMAVTEVHLGCTREEQLRWFVEMWDAAGRAREEGADVRAVTAWSLLGAYDWDSLSTRDDGHYESGVFDLRADRPRPTALVPLLRDLAAGRPVDHPALDMPGWWHRPERLLSSRTGRPAADSVLKHPPMTGGGRGRPLMILGATGTLGRAFARLCELRGLPYHLLARHDVDMTDAASVAEALEARRPWAVVNAAGYVRVDDAEREPEACHRANSEGPAALAKACARRDLPFLTFSSDLVFGGQGRTPFVESDPLGPLNVYGRSKAEAEARVLEALPRALVVRTSAFFGPWDEHNFATIALRELAAGRPFVAAEDAIISPTYVPDLVNASLDLLIDGERGLWHLTNVAAISWADLARRVAEWVGLDPAGVEGRPTAALGLAAPRALWSVLGSERGTLLPSLDDALGRFVAQSEVDWADGRTPPRLRPHADQTPSPAESGVGLFFDGTARQDPVALPMSPAPQVPSLG